MKTVIVALYPYNSQGLDSWIDHGAGMTYTAAKEAGCDVGFVDMKALHNDEELKYAIRGYDLVAISMKSSYYAYGMKVTKFAKEQGSKVMIGGYHATAAPHELTENGDVDYIFHGESEITFPRFLKDPSKFEREIYGEKPQNLDDLPFLDRTIYRTPIEDCRGWWHGGKLARMTTVMAARGCPYKCAFCQPLENNHFGKKLRRRSVDSIISELRILKEQLRPDCLMIHDDTFLLQSRWLEEFIEKYPEIGLPFWAAGRADGICKHEELVKRLVKVGWELISVGFESGSQRILDLLKKGTTIEQNLESAKIIRSAGAKIYGNYLVGLPWETKWDIQETYKMADTIAAEMPSWAYFTPYPGCELGEKLIKRGWSLLDRNSYDRCPSGEKVKHVDYDYLTRMRMGLREEVYPEFTDIIIPTYNNEHYTVACLETIKKFTKPGSYRVIWVDNGSDCLEKVEEVISDMGHVSIKLPTNEGFVGAINKGLEVSDAPNVCLLNNDTEVTDRWLEKLLSALYSSDKVGLVGPLTNYGEGVQQMDSHHSLSVHHTLLPTEATSWGMEKLNSALESTYKGQTHPITFVAFLCAVIKREVIDKVGHLDPNYEMGMWDDMDYNRSAIEVGYEPMLALDTCITHHGRTTFKIIQERENFNINKLLLNNKLYLDRKWRKIYAKKGTKQNLNYDKTYIISRAIYTHMGEDNSAGVLTEARLALMQKYFINSLANQTDKDFTVYLIVGEYENYTVKRIESLDWSRVNVQFVYTDGDLSEWKASVANTGNLSSEDSGSPEDKVRKLGHPQANIMARLDTDDWVAPGWIAHMKHMARTKPESHFLINYRVMGQGPDGRLYSLSIPHHKNRTSPFIALVQKESPRISPYMDFHLNMGSRFSTVYTIPPMYAFMVVHGDNRHNKIRAEDKFLEEWRPEEEEKTVVNISRPIVQGTDWRARIARGMQSQPIGV